MNGGTYTHRDGIAAAARTVPREQGENRSREKYNILHTLLYIIYTYIICFAVRSVSPGGRGPCSSTYILRLYSTSCARDEDVQRSYFDVPFRVRL